MLGGAADGLFLGRFAHDTEAVKTILDEGRNEASCAFTLFSLC